MNFDPGVFRKYDIRGKAGSGMTPLFGYVLGRALAGYFGFAGEKVLIGRDCRLASPSLYENLTFGLAAGGAFPVLLGEVPTPCMYFAVATSDITRGIMVTASHNPKEYAGFKICDHYGPMSDGELKRLHASMEEEYVRLSETGDALLASILDGQAALRSSCGDLAGNISELPGIREKYLDEAEKRLREIYPAAAGRPGLEIALDGSSGVAGELCSELLRRMGAHVIGINLEPDGNFPAHKPDPTDEENVRELCDIVAGRGLAAGFGLDGDGDRMAAVDGRGRLLPADITMELLAEDMLGRRPEYAGRSFVIDVKCSQMLMDRLKELGLVPVLCATGHSFMQEGIRRSDAVFGGELAGHFFLCENWYGFDDGTFAAASAYCALVSRGTRFEGYMDGRKGVSTPELKFACTDADKPRLMEAARNRFSSFPHWDIDGMRVDTGNGWFLVRPSNTGDYISLRFEANDQARLDELRGMVETVLCGALEHS